MDAAVSLHHHHHGVLALPASLHHHHGALPLPLPLNQRRRPSTKPPAARLTLATRPPSPARSAPAAALPVAASVADAAAASHHSSRAATGYAAALADACVRAGTLRRASRHARAALGLSREKQVVGQLDARVAALVRMLVTKGKAGMVAEVLAEFAAICDKLLPRHPARAHGY